MMKIPKHTLWQYLEKEHLDPDNKLTNEQWKTFIEKNNDSFADFCSEVGQELFADFYYAEVKK